LPIRGYKGWDTEEGVKWGFKEEGMPLKGRSGLILCFKKGENVCFYFLAGFIH
jgi:hypothetical protein